MELAEELKKVLLAGIGAAAYTAEKSKAVIDAFVEKGALTVEQGKVMNEELKRNLKQAGQSQTHPAAGKGSASPTPQQVEQAPSHMTAQQRAAIKQKIEQMENSADG